VRSRLAAGLAVTVALGALAGCGGDDSFERARELRRRNAGADLEIAGIPEDGVLLGNTATLELSASRLRVVEPDGDTSGRTGHFVVFVDAEPVPVGAEVEPGEGVIEAFENPVRVTGLDAGSHEVSVVVADGAGRRMNDHLATATMQVKPPTLNASAPEKNEAGAPVAISIEVEGVQPAPAGPDTSGATGHFALFVNREPTAMGDPVPVERGVIHSADLVVNVPELGGGEHFVWVVLLKGDKTPFDPLVADKVVFEVASAPPPAEGAPAAEG
jgi:hypothetical protein